MSKSINKLCSSVNVRQSERNVAGTCSKSRHQTYSSAARRCMKCPPCTACRQLLHNVMMSCCVAVGLVVCDAFNVRSAVHAVFTARCTLVQSAVLRSHVVRPSVCPSVCDVGGSRPHRSEILETNFTDN